MTAQQQPGEPCIECNSPDRRRLLLLRGNSGSGKTTVAHALRSIYGRGLAIVGQDVLRREVLWEHDKSASTGLTPVLIAQTALLALGHGYHVLVEGILATPRYRAALAGLIARHTGPSLVYWLDASFEETARRHTTRPQAAQFTTEQMRAWYRGRDLLGVPGEHIIDESSTVEQTVAYMLRTSGLEGSPPLTWCPVSCPQCRDDNSATAAHGPLPAMLLHEQEPANPTDGRPHDTRPIAGHSDGTNLGKE